MMEPIDEDTVIAGAVSSTAAPSPSRSSVIQTLTSGRKRDVKGGAFQAHICVVASLQDVKEVMSAFEQSDGFRSVTSWCCAYRIVEPGSLGSQDSCFQPLLEASDDGLDEGCGQKLLSVLRRYALEGLLLVVSRWQDYGATSGLEVFGNELYGIVVERCKDLIMNLKQAVGTSDSEVVKCMDKPTPSRKTYDFSFLPPLKEPRVPQKFGPNHFLADTSMNKPASLPHLFNGGDVRLWMANDQILRHLPEAEIWAMRSLRQPDYRIERVLQAVSILKGIKVAPATTAAARWGHCREVIKSPTLRTELMLFDAACVPPEAAQRALELVQGLEAEDIRRVSAGAAALYEWVRGVARWRLEGPPPEPSQEDLSQGIPLHPLQPREAVMLRQSSCPALKRNSSGTRLQQCVPSGDASFRKRVPVSSALATR